MNTFRILCLLLLTASNCAFATPASEASIKELIAVTEAKKLIDGIKGQVDTMMNNSLQQTLAGRAPTPEQQQAITKMKGRMVELIQNELSWEKYEQMYLRIYKDLFSEEEIAGMLDFYRTPAGQAVVRKLPLLTQKIMLETRSMMSSMMPQMQKIQEEFVADMKAAGK